MQIGIALKSACMASYLYGQRKQGIFFSFSNSSQNSVCIVLYTITHTALMTVSYAAAFAGGGNNLVHEKGKTETKGKSLLLELQLGHSNCT